MSGGYGANGGGAGRGSGYGRGYGEQDGYGDEDYGSRGQGRPRRQAGTQPPWDDPRARTGQPRGRAGRPAGPGQGYGQGYDQSGGWPDPRGQGQGPRQPASAPRGPRGGQHRGGDPGRQAPGGYDPRGTAPRRGSGGYPSDGYPGEGYPASGYPGRADPRAGQSGGYPGWGDDQGDESGFVPGFGEDDYDDGGAGRRGRRGGRGRGDRRGGGGGDWDDGGTGKRRRGPVRRLAPWVALVVILTPIVLGGVYVYHRYENRYHPADYAGPGTGSVTVQVKSGDTAFSLGPRLQALGVVASARAFELAAESHTTTTAAAPTLEAGFYKLHMHMQASLAYSALLNPKDRVQLTVTVPEGKRASQVVAILAKQTSIPAADFQQVLDHPAGLGLPSYAGGKPEGYLFPATYTIQPNETALQILQAMVQRYNAEAGQINITAAARAVGLTPATLITEASMAQAEGGVVSDYPKIARVIINRLHDGMKLQFDSVLLYGLNAYGVNVTFKQIDTPGPYNDFQHAGLPPGPICNPGNAAIQAILHPANGPWLYFLTKTGGGASQFSATPLPGMK